MKKWPNLFNKKEVSGDSAADKRRGVRRFLRWPQFSVDLSLPAHRWKFLGALLALLIVGAGLVTGAVEG